MDGYCEHHKPIQLSYIKWHDMASRRYNQRYIQVKCKTCNRYLFPDELNEPENEKSKKVIDNHNAWLEKHPNAKDSVLIDFSGTFIFNGWTVNT